MSCLGGVEARQVAEFGDEEDGHGALDTAHGLDRPDNRAEAPRLGLCTEFSREPVEAFLRCRNGADIFLEDTRLGRRGTDGCRQPAQRRWPPGGAALIPAIPTPQERVQAVLSGLESPDHALPGTGEGAERLVLGRRDIGRRQSAGTPEPGQPERVTASGVGTATRFRRDAGGGHDPAAQALLGGRAVEPVPAGLRFVNTDELFGWRAEGADTRVKVALAGPNAPHADALGVPRLTGRGHGDAISMDIRPATECPRLMHG
jgi:hypothetical protein